MNLLRPWRDLTVPGVLVVLLLGQGIPVTLADGDAAWSYSSGRFDNVSTLIEGNDYPAAIAELQELLKETPEDADTLNLLGFAHRKYGQYDAALDYYEKALAVDPEHRGAIEYLGELYLQTGQPELAEEQLARLSRLCRLCSERRDLKNAIRDYREANPTVQ